MVQFFEFDVPDHLSLHVGSQPNDFAEVSRQQLEVIDKYMGISPHHAVLEIGCGPGKLAIPLAKRLTTGRYTGIDISEECVRWCSSHINPSHPNVEFFFADLQSSMYNPTGTQSDAGYRFPLESGSVDRIVLCSVFTHMMEDGIQNYLNEFRRVLRPAGSIFATWFIVSDVAIRYCRLAPGPIGNFTFEFKITENCWVNDVHHPLGTVGFKLPWIIEKATKARLQIDCIVNSYWSGAYPGADMGQDLTIMSPATA